MTFTAESIDENKRVDRFVAENQSDFSRSAMEKLFAGNKVWVNGIPRPKNYKLKINDEIEITCDNIPHINATNISVKPKCLPVNIIYEDTELLVVNKPQGMPVHPVSDDDDDTLASALLNHCGGKLSMLAGAFRPGIVHRIDKDTSGLLVVAKTDTAYEKLAVQVESHTMLRRYEGIVHGNINQNSGVIDLAVGRHPVHRTKRAVLPAEATGARRAVTRYRVIGLYNGFSHVEFELETGRTHQIRVHMAYMGHPVAGDQLYGYSKPVKGFKGQCLHARTLAFIHPSTGERLEFSSVLPDYFANFLAKLSSEAGD